MAPKVKRSSAAAAATPHSPPSPPATVARNEPEAPKFLQLTLSAGPESTPPNALLLSSKAMSDLGRSVTQGSLLHVAPKPRANDPNSSSSNSNSESALLLGVLRDSEQDRMSRGGNASSTYARLSAKTIAAAFPHTTSEVIVSVPQPNNRTDVPDAVTISISLVAIGEEPVASSSSFSAVDLKLAFERTLPRNSGAASIVFPEMAFACPVGSRLITVKVDAVETSSSSSSSSSSAAAAAAATAASPPLSCCAHFTATTRLIVGGTGSESTAAEQQQQAAPSPPPVSSMIVCGTSGQGKSHRLRSFAAEFESVEWVAGGSVSDLPVADRIRTIRSLSSQQQQSRTNSVVVFDDVDLLLDDAMVVAALRSLLGHSSPFTAVAMSCGSSIQSADALKQILLPGGLGSSRWKIESMVLPTPTERVTILRSMLQGEHAQLLGQAIVEVGEAAHGFSPLDLRLVVDTAVSIAAREASGGSSLVIKPEHLQLARRNVQPTALRSVNAAPPPSLRWSDIGGSDEAKSALQQCLVFASAKSQRAFARLGVTPPRGVLLFGPPGNSKTMLAKAVASAGGMNFISVKGPEVFSKWVGDSEKAVRDIFDRARAAAPCVVFIDELDGMCGKRGGGGVGDRVISQLLVELDGMKTTGGTGSGAGIVFIAATNRPDCIDDAILRPGRIDKKIYVGLPEEADREKIFHIALNGIPLDAAVKAAELAQRTPGYTGAEVVSVCKRAAALAVHDDVGADCVKPKHFDSALAELKPRISQRDVDWYFDWARGAR